MIMARGKYKQKNVNKSAITYKSDCIEFFSIKLNKVLYGKRRAFDSQSTVVDG